MSKKKVQSMKLEQLIVIANEAYPDSLIQEAYDANKDRGVEDGQVSVGDGLAEFISREIVDTYDPKASSLEQLQEAARCMVSAQKELTAVAEWLTKVLIEKAVAKAKK